MVALVSGGEVVALAELQDIGGVMQHSRYSTASIDNKNVRSCFFEAITGEGEQRAMQGEPGRACFACIQFCDNM